MTTERVRWTKTHDQAYDVFEATMAGGIKLRVFSWAPLAWRWSVELILANHYIRTAPSRRPWVTSARQAKRRAREAGLMVQKIVGVK